MRLPPVTRMVVAGFALVVALACGPSEEDVARAEHGYCETPRPLEWAPETGTLHLQVRDAPPGSAGEPRWGSGNTEAFVAPERVAGYGVAPGYVACLDVTHEILDTRQYFDENERQRTFHRTRASGHLRVYQARTGRMVHESRHTGTDPPAWEVEFVDHARYLGRIDDDAVAAALRDVLPPLDE